MSTCDICERVVTYSRIRDANRLAARFTHKGARLNAIKASDRVEWANIFTGRSTELRLRTGVVEEVGATHVWVKTPGNRIEMLDKDLVTILPTDPQEEGARAARQHINQMRYRFQRSVTFTEDVLHVYSRHTTQSRLIGKIDRGSIPNFLAGATTGFEPVDNWQNTFSSELIERLGLQR